MKLLNFLSAVWNLGNDALIGYDPLIALAIVFFVEYVIKELIFKRIIKKEVPVAVMKLSPVAVGAVGYAIYAIITSNPWYMGVVHGLFVGLGAMGAYDALLKKGLELIKNFVKWILGGSKDALEKANEEARKILEEKK